MQTVRIFYLKNINRTQNTLMFEGSKESARVWNFCTETHKKAREEKRKWPWRDELQKLTKGKFQLHSQSVQAVCHAFLANVDTATQLKKTNKRIRLPYKEKHFYPLMWPKQAVFYENGCLTLPMGRKRKSLQFRVDLEGENIGACKIVWNDGYELHVVIESEEPIIDMTKEPKRAAVDLGQIHLAAVTIENGKSLIVSGRGIRTIKRQRNKAFSRLAQKKERCSPDSRRHKKLQRAKKKVGARAKRKIRDQRHKATTQVIEFCKKEGVTDLYVGDPSGVQKKNCGRHQNQRMSQWEFGKDISYLEHKSIKAGISCFSGSERGTSSHCPKCGHKQKVTGRKWECKRCDLRMHRDVVGSVNMFPLGFGIKIDLPNHITYLRPGPLRRPRRSSSLDTGQGCLAKLQRSNQQQCCVV